jgi:hypothetical protein
MVKLIKIIPSDVKGKKYSAYFDLGNGKEKKVNFGAKGYDDFTTHKDEERKKRYLDRHRNNEDWNKYMTAGSLSRWILWNQPSLRSSISDFRKRFNI